jgi:hypothetical protein
LIAKELVPLVLDGAGSPCTVTDLERRLAGAERWGLIRPVILHLLWRSLLVADLSRRLDGDTIVRAGVVG